MSILQDIAAVCVNWSLGFTILIGLAATDFSGAGTIVALPIAATAVTLSALCHSSLNPPPDTNYNRKRKCCDILDFFQIWIEILEILTAAATSARVVSATVDYISDKKFRDWFLGLQSHSLGEPWPDVVGVTVIVVIIALFMLGLEKSSSFSLLLLLCILTSFTFFIVVGGSHTVIKLSNWWLDIKTHSLQSILTAAAMCSYCFVTKFPKFDHHKYLKTITFAVVPLVVYAATILVFTLMSHYRELTGSATPLIRVFELRDVDWARVVMATSIMSIALLSLTELLPILFGLFLTLASNKWQIFLSSLQYQNSFTGAPILAIFAAGSLAAILAFACPLSYLLKILNTSTLLKCVFISIQVIYTQYKPEFNNDSYLVSSTTAHYSKLKRSSTKATSTGKSTTTNRLTSSLMGCFRNNKSLVSASTNRCKRNKPDGGTTEDKECLLLNDYSDKSVDVVLGEDTISSDDESDRNDDTVMASDCEDSGSSGTDIDAIVQEYRDRIQVATVDNFNANRSPTHVTATIVALFSLVIIITTTCLSVFIRLKKYYWLWPCGAASSLSTAIILLMPKNSASPEEKLLPKSITPICAILALEMNIVLAVMLLEDIWPGYIFWFGAGTFLFWKCDCCNCQGLVAVGNGTNHRNKLNITENLCQYKDNYVDTVLIAR